MKRVNFLRVVKFAVILFLFHFIIGLLSPSYNDLESEGARIFASAFQYLIEAVGIAAIFYIHAKLQCNMLYIHVACVFILYQIITLSLSFALFGQLATVSTTEFILDWIVFGVSVVVGTEIGRRLKGSTKFESI